MRVQGANKNPNLTQVTEAVVDTTTVTDSQSKQQIHNVFIIDASGSMGGGKYERAISGVNELLVSISQDTDTNNTVRKACYGAPCHTITIQALFHGCNIVIYICHTNARLTNTVHVK